MTVHDNVTVSGLAGTPTGTVTFHLFSTSNCSGTSSNQGPVNLSGGGAESNSFVTTTAGGQSYLVDYSRDANYQATTGDPSTDCESLTLDKIQPSLETVIHFTDHSTATSPITFGGTVHDAATASAPSGYVEAPPAPSGNVDFRFFTNNLCTSGTGTSAGTVALASGVADPSSSEGPLTVGSYAFNASYGGDDVYKSASAACEPLAVVSSISNMTYQINGGATLYKCHVDDLNGTGALIPLDPSTCPLKAA